MSINILFGEVTGDYLKETLDNESPILVCDGQYFDFGVNISEETVNIFDALGRHIPIGIDEFDSMLKALKVARPYVKALLKAETINSIMEDGETLVICD